VISFCEEEDIPFSICKKNNYKIIVDEKLRLNNYEKK